MTNDFSCRWFSARGLQVSRLMCGLLSAILIDSRPSTTVISTWHSDLSGLPLSKRRAYGRVISAQFLCRDATIKCLKPIYNHRSTNPSKVYALTLTGSEGTQVIVYFARKIDQTLERFEYRHRPTDHPKKGSIPVGVTSVQFITYDPKSGQMQSHIYRDAYSARLFIGGANKNRVIGSIVTVFPDSHRSFVSGSFKARVVGFGIR